jgi:stage V sporulation protein B
VSAALKVNDRKLAAQISETALRTTALLAIPAGVGLSVLGEPIIRLLYPSTDVELGGWMLTVLGLAAIAVCFMLVSNSVMQAHKLVTLPMDTTIVGCALKLVVGYALIGSPDVGVKGGAISTIVCFGLIALLDLIIIKLTLPRSLSYVRVFAKPVLASVVMGFAAWAVYGLLSKVLSHGGGLTGMANAVSVLAAIAVGGVVYLALILVTRAISRDDLSLMPKGDKLARLLRVR